MRQVHHRPPSGVRTANVTLWFKFVYICLALTHGLCLPARKPRVCITVLCCHSLDRGRAPLLWNQGNGYHMLAELAASLKIVLHMIETARTAVFDFCRHLALRVSLSGMCTSPSCHGLAGRTGILILVTKFRLNNPASMSAIQIWRDGSAPQNNVTWFVGSALAHQFPTPVEGLLAFWPRHALPERGRECCSPPLIWLQEGSPGKGSHAPTRL